MDDYISFITKMHQKLGLDLSLYKEAQMKRRLTSLRDKRGFSDFDMYYNGIQKDKALLEEFVDRITINVSEFYRNPARWKVLEQNVIPELIKEKKVLHIWSAACSTGEEPYSLLMLFQDHFPGIKVKITATDIDEKILKRAQQGIYKPQSLKDLPEEKKSKYFIFKDGLYFINNDLKKQVTFKKHNLLNDPYPTNIDMIVCRNVLIYFTDPAKDLVYKAFSKALSPGGMLFVGSTEQIFNPQDYALELYDTFFYRKLMD